MKIEKKQKQKTKK